jgi:hypothetical protein
MVAFDASLHQSMELVTDAEAMRRTLDFITIDLALSALVTCGLAAFWLLCVDAATEDVSAFLQKASTNQRAKEYAASIMAAEHWPSHGQLILAQATVSEILNRTSDTGHESTALPNVPLRAYAPLLMAHLCVTLILGMCIRFLRRSQKE